MNQADKLCQEHSEPIILEDNKNIKWCLTCVQTKCNNEIVNVEEFTDEYQQILDSQSHDNKINTLQNILKLIEKYKKLLTDSLNEKNMKQKKFLCQIINEYSNKYMDCCRSFVFNQDSTKLFIGQLYNISVYEFKNGEINKQLQTLKQHKNLIFCLVYMNKSNLLISGSWDKSIIIWNKDQNGSWKLYQMLEGHQDWINCMINNRDEELIISGGEDKTLKFWRKVNQNWSCQQTIQTKFSIYSLSISKSQSKLISCGVLSDEILVMEQKPDQQWMVSQIINTNGDGQQLCFISDNQFAYQGMQDYLDIYLYNQEKKLFVKDKEINVQNNNGFYHLFPCKYIESKNTLIMKNGKYLNCFGMDQKSNYILQQSFEYKNGFLGVSFFGNISNDGQFIVTYDYRSEAIKVEQLQYLEQK